MGEHEEVARILRQLTLNGIKVVITPGNHDVNNPEAARYNKDKSFSVPTIQADKIQSIYAHFGYKDAIARDPNSLSYVSEPIEGLRIIAIDANKYYENTTTTIGSGVIKPATMTWIKEQLTDARDKGKSVIGMMHHASPCSYINNCKRENTSYYELQSFHSGCKYINIIEILAIKFPYLLALFLNKFYICR